MNVTGIATQGRNSPKEYVMEYGISYGSNGLDYADYREVDGSTKVLAANSVYVTNAFRRFVGFVTRIFRVLIVFRPFVNAAVSFHVNYRFWRMASIDK